MKNFKLETETDIQLLKAIAKTGFITECFLEYVGISAKRFKEHIKSGCIENKGTYLIYGNLRNVYFLSAKSKRKVRSDFAINPYKSDFSQLEHDYCLAKVYHYLSFQEKQSWITETELRVKYRHDKTTDAMYISKEGKKVGVEIVTDRYSKDEIENKMNFIRSFCDDYIMFHTHKKKEYIV